ncbi:MAG: DUF4105 domain-containing protein [Bacteroidota bacterium]
MKKACLLFVFIITLFTQRISAQDSASHLRISLLTAGAGEELYSTWGHTALRIIDSVKQTDIIFNFGFFDFNDPDFYSKFTRGKLDYFLVAQSFTDFMYEYQVEKRYVIEQELLLSANSKLSIQEVLIQTLNSSARVYKYDFLYNNCTSRVRDILIKYGGLKSERALVPPGTTFRNMLHEFLDKGHPWSKLGIDLLLGSPIDKVANNTESMFLPEYLMKGVDSSQNLVLQKMVLLNGAPAEMPNNKLPLYIFSVITIVIFGISVIKNKTARIITRVLDITLFLVTGLLGCFLLFMWFGTDHKACAANYNLLWALPTNLVVVFALWKNPRWLQKYFYLCMVIHILTLLLWFWLPQQFNIALIPVVALLLQRCWKLGKL